MALHNKRQDAARKKKQDNQRKIDARVKRNIAAEKRILAAKKAAKKKQPLSDKDPKNPINKRKLKDIPNPLFGLSKIAAKKKADKARVTRARARRNKRLKEADRKARNATQRKTKER